MVLNIGVPSSPVFDFSLFRYGVTEIGTGTAVEAEVRLFIPVLAAMGVGWDVAVLVGESLFRGPGKRDGRGGEETRSNEL